MASSFLIAYPDVPALALAYTPSATFDTDHAVECAFYGERHTYAALASGTTSVSITFDLGNSLARTVDHFIIGDAWALQSNGVTKAVLQGSSDGSTWVDQLGTNSNFQSKTLYGPNSKDFLCYDGFNDDIADALASYRYFKVTLTSAGSHVFPLSKLYFGTALDLGKEPDYYEWEALSDDVDTWRSPRGSVAMTRSAPTRHRVRVEWDGVTDTKAALFCTTLLSNPYRNTVFLYTTTNLDPLFDKRLLHCRVIADECFVEKPDAKSDWNMVTAVFEELP